MIIYPALDIQAGKCVRLYQGCFDQQICYHTDPIMQAFLFSEMGATYLHIVDLDGAKRGQPMQTHLIIKIASQISAKIRVGGGVRTQQQIKQLLDNRIYRVVLGGIAVTQITLIKQWLNEFDPERIALAFDVRIKNNNPIIVINGWQNESEKNLWQVLDAYQDSSLKHVICTDVDRDGTLQGINVDLYQMCRKRYSNICFQASGGICSLEDLQTLSNHSLAGAIVGKALYENKFSLQQALKIDANNHIIEEKKC